MPSDMLLSKNNMKSVSTRESDSNQIFREKYSLTIEIEDFLFLKDALIRAIDAFNSTTKEFKISRDVTKYSMRLAKKNGRPNMDVPVLNPNNSIMTSQVDLISVVFEQSHITHSTLNKYSVTSAVQQDQAFAFKPQKTSACYKCCKFCLIY